MSTTKILNVEIEKGIRYRDTGAWKKAVSLFKKLLKDKPESAEILSNLAHTYVRQRRYEIAISTFLKALNSDDNHVYTLIQLGKTYCQIGEFSLSLNYLKKAEKLSLNLQEKNTLNEWLKNAQEYINDAISLGVESTLGAKQMGIQLYLKGNELTLQGDLEQGVKAYELASKCRVDYSNPELNIGVTVSTHNSRMPKEEYQSCSWLEEGLHFHDDRLTFCCTAHSVNKGWTKIGQFNGGKLPIDFILAKRALTAKQLMTGEENNCTGCPSLKKKEWPKTEYHFAHLIFNNFSVCNFRCTYCSLTHQNFEMPAYYFSAEEAVNDILDNNWLNPNGTSTWGGGDPSVSREFRNLLHKLTDRGSFNIINTNAAIHIQDIENALRDGKANILVSIDAGTHEVFDAIKFGNDNSSLSPTLIKGKPALDAVWETLGKYIKASPDDVVVKYIVDHINSSETEIDEFINLCKKHKVKKLMMTPEAEFIRQIPITKSILPATIFNTISYATKRALENEIECIFDPNVYRKEVFLPTEQVLEDTRIIAKAV